LINISTTSKVFKDILQIEIELYIIFIKIIIFMEGVLGFWGFGVLGLGFRV